MSRFSLVLLSLFVAGCVTPAPLANRLETTPRHDEWVALAREGRTLHAYVSWPQVATPAPAVIVIHENRGLTDWVRVVADQLSERGYVAIAPDFLSGMAPGGGRTSDFPSQDAAREAISKLPPAQVLADLHAAADYIRARPAVSGSVSVAGFCWGGARAFDFANHRQGLTAVYVFYGTGPESEEQVAAIDAPIFGFYGGNDARVNATIPRTEELLRAENVPFDYVIYEGAGHAFMREGELPTASAENRRARDQAWQRWLTLLRQ